MSNKNNKQDASFFLTAAREALDAGQARLAIHLYYAAFELDNSQGHTAGEEVINGMRTAWNLACEMGDRSTAESLLSELEPFNTDDQNAIDILRLQGLAIGQLEAIGISSDNLKGMTGAVVEAMGGSNRDNLKSAIKAALVGNNISSEGEGNPFKGLLLAIGASNGSDDDADNPDDQTDEAIERVAKAGSGGRDDATWRLDYDHIMGFQTLLKRMQEFGFYPADDQEKRRFVERMASLHNVYPLALNEPFLFIGPDNSDLEFFAEATANEIGNPVLHVKADMDDMGNGSIKLAGPFRHRLFGGPPDLSDLQTPCTVLITGLDKLQQIFQHSDSVSRFEARHQSPGWEQPARRNVYSELGAFLRELLSRPGVFLMATADEGFQPVDLTLNVLGSMLEIRVDNPTADERRQLWEKLQQHHVSLSYLDVEELVEYSKGLSRSTIFGCAQDVLSGAYRASLRQGSFQEVKLGDVLNRLAVFIDHQSETYQQIEDLVVAEFSAELESDLL